MQSWHLERAPTLTAELERNGLEDFVVDSDDRPVRLVAKDMLTRAGGSSCGPDTTRS